MKTKIILTLAFILLLMPVVTATPRVLVVGWDGAEWDNIKPLLQKGEMPTFKSLSNQASTAT